MSAFQTPFAPSIIAPALRALHCPPFRVVSLPTLPFMQTLLRKRFTEERKIHAFIKANPHLLHETHNKMPDVLKAVYRHAMKEAGLPNHRVVVINEKGHPVASMLEITPVPTLAHAIQAKPPLGVNPMHIAAVWPECYPGRILDAVQGPFGDDLRRLHPVIKLSQDPHLLIEDPMSILPRTIAPFTKDSGIEGNQHKEMSSWLYYTIPNTGDSPIDEKNSLLEC